MSVETELEALRTAAAISPLTDRAFLRITGPDATRWLNGMVTNNIKDLAPGEGNYNFLLNAQGRIQGDCTIYREPSSTEPSYLLETDKSQIETIHPLLDRFIIMDDVELTNWNANQQSILVIGPGVANFLMEQSMPIKGLARLKHIEMDGSEAWISTHGHDFPEFELRGDKSVIDTLLPGFNAVPISPETLEAHRILSATPKFGIDIRDRDLPQETAQTHALHFNKGCYLGQEIVERIRSRGQVHRTFTAFTLTGSLPQLPAPLEANGKPAGELTSAIQIGSTIHALGYLRREFATHPLTYPNGTATPKNL